MGKIGRHNVCALVKGEVDIQTDISGIVYINMDNGESWKIKLISELKNAGYEVDANAIIK